MNASYVLEKAANDADSPEDRIALLERASSLPGTYYVADLLELYARTDVRKAADVAKEKLKAAHGGKATKGTEAALSEYQVAELSAAADYYGALAHAQDLLKAGQLAEAMAATEKANPSDDSGAPLNTFPKTKLMTDVLLAQGSTLKAYTYLLDDREVIADPERTAMAVKIGGQLGKADAQVQDEIVSAALASAKQPHDFELENLKGDAKVKLSEFRGKYVLVNFWHPT
jgi:hypothetical protein